MPMITYFGILCRSRQPSFLQRAGAGAKPFFYPARFCDR